ncbi:unnamed protein product [Cladocopium goreaui]|uniref:Methyltransferase domain-containing protein n=1 Tax=Cladocopium goreaui TaxID=2562237 RepID=A0A9P1M4D4_9DINO|nr:unnamed protein product [Cladocopium goreaui]
MAKSSPLAPRLLAVANAALAAGPQLCIADIGCYVGNLAVHLVQQGARVVAIDVAPGPLELARQKAQDVLSTEGQSRLEFRLGDGFAALKVEDDVGVACLAGLPAGLLLQLLNSTPPSVTRLVLQPTCPTAPEAMAALRCWLHDSAWQLTEHISLERGGACITLVADALEDQQGNVHHSGECTAVAQHRAQLLPMTLRERVFQQLLQGVEDDETNAYIELLHEYSGRLCTCDKRWMMEVVEEELSLVKALQSRFASPG